jgi:hypothetical protein
MYAAFREGRLDDKLLAKPKSVKSIELEPSE